MLRKWLFICATKPEWGELKKYLAFQKAHFGHELNFYRAEMNQKEILLAQVGPGYESAKQRASLIFNSINRPDLVIHFGLSGALTENFKEGDLILADSVINPDKQSVAVSPDLIQKSRLLLQELKLPAAGGALFTSPKVLTTPSIKKKAGEEFSAVAVDMETYPFAKECEKKGIPFLSLRAIWDPLDWDLSEISDIHFFDPNGNLKTARFLGNALAHPRLLFSLPKYQSAMAKGNRGITRFLIGAIRRWE